MILLSFFINKRGKKLAKINDVLEDYKVISNPKRKIFGAITVLIGLSSWVYGLVNRKLSRNYEVILMGIAVYGLILGMLWLITGKKTRDN